MTPAAQNTPQQAMDGLGVRLNDAERDRERAEQELRERFDVIKLLAGFIAEPDCEVCEGDGWDDDGEWTLCQCVLMKVVAGREDHSDD